jgi:transposase
VARILLDQIDGLTAQIDTLTGRIDHLVNELPAEGSTETSAGSSDGPGMTTVDRLAEVPGLSRDTAPTLIAEIGLDMTRFATAGHLASWTRLTPRTIQSGARQRRGKTGKGNPYLKGLLGQAAATAARTDTFLGERYRRLVKRRGKGKALVAVARSIVIIVWHLLNDPDLRYHDLGPDYHTTRVNTTRKIRNLVHQLEALGLTVAIQPAA